MVVEYNTNALRISGEILTSRFSSSLPHLPPALCGYTPAPRLIHFLLPSRVRRAEEGVKKKSENSKSYNHYQEISFSKVYTYTDWITGTLSVFVVDKRNPRDCFFIRTNCRNLWRRLLEKLVASSPGVRVNCWRQGKERWTERTVTGFKHYKLRIRLISYN